MDNSVNKYLEQELMSASPAKLVFMLYERAIGSLHEAIAAIEANDIEGRWRANNRASEIIGHMWATLNLDEGGEISKNLAQIFPFAMRRLVQVDVKNDPEPAREVISLLEPLRDAWRELASAAPGQAPQGPEAPQPPEPTTGSETSGPDAVPPVRTSISA